MKRRIDSPNSCVVIVIVVLFFEIYKTKYIKE